MAAPPRDPPSLIAVHVGAGWHAPAKEAAYKAAMCAAISAARSHLARPGATSLGAAVAAMRVLEVCRRVAALLAFWEPVRADARQEPPTDCAREAPAGCGRAARRTPEARPQRRRPRARRGCSIRPLSTPAPQDSPLTNAGYGSNLNLAGSVECDAAAMAGDGAYGALGAAPGVRHPAAAAAVLAEESREPLPLGLVRPM